jgi:hypothetical protein
MDQQPTMIQFFDDFRITVLDNNVTTIAVEFMSGKYAGFIFQTTEIGLIPKGDDLYDIHFHYVVTCQKGLYEVKSFHKAATYCIRQYIQRHIDEQNAQERSPNPPRLVDQQ